MVLDHICVYLNYDNISLHTIKQHFWNYSLNAMCSIFALCAGLCTYKLQLGRLCKLAIKTPVSGRPESSSSAVCRWSNWSTSATAACSASTACCRVARSASRRECSSRRVSSAAACPASSVCRCVDFLREPLLLPGLGLVRALVALERGTIGLRGVSIGLVLLTCLSERCPIGFDLPPLLGQLGPVSVEADFASLPVRPGHGQGPPARAGRFVVQDEISSASDLSPAEPKWRSASRSRHSSAGTGPVPRGLPAIGFPSHRSLVRRGEPILRSMEVGFPLVEARGPLLQILCRRGELAARRLKLCLGGLEDRSVGRERSASFCRLARLVSSSLSRVCDASSRGPAPAAADRCSCRSASTFA